MKFLPEQSRSFINVDYAKSLNLPVYSRKMLHRSPGGPFYTTSQTNFTMATIISPDKRFKLENHIFFLTAGKYPISWPSDFDEGEANVGIGSDLAWLVALHGPEDALLNSAVEERTGLYGTVLHVYVKK